MKSKVPVSRDRPLLNQRHRGTITLVFLLIILLGSFALVLRMARNNQQVRTGAVAIQSSSVHTQHLQTTSPGVYVGSNEGTLNKLNPATGAILWQFKTVGRSIPAAPAVDASVVYLGSQEGNLYALNAGNGSVIWQFHAGGEIIASPVVANGLVFAGASDGNLYAVNAATGKAQWSYRTGPGNSALTASTVAVSNGVVYGSSTDEVAVSYLYAVNAATGAQVWRITLQNQSYTAPQAVNGVLYLASWTLQQQGGPVVSDSYVYAYNAKDGALLWRSLKVGDSILSMPTIAGGTVYAGSLDSNLYAFQATTGKLLWRTGLGGQITSSPQIANGVLYTGVVIAGTPTNGNSDTTAPRGVLVAVNATSGAIQWQRSEANYQGTPLAVFQSTLYFGATDGGVYALSIRNGATIWNRMGATGTVILPGSEPITVAP